MQTIKINHPRRQQFKGAILYEDAKAVRYVVLAESMSHQTVFMQRQSQEGEQWINTEIYAIAPTHRIQLHAEYIEPGPWLQIFRNPPLAAA